jgi:hypothetical protein
MNSPIGPTSENIDPVAPVTAMAAEPDAAEGVWTRVFEDPYAENELTTRHERTERAIRKAQEQS